MPIVPSCPGRIVDNWRTVWHCELEPHETGLCRYGVMQWVTPGIGDRPQYVIRDSPVDFYQWDGESTDHPDWLQAHSVDDLFGALRFRVDDRGGFRHLFPNEWAVRWSGGRVITFPPDQFAQHFEART